MLLFIKDDERTLIAVGWLLYVHIGAIIITTWPCLLLTDIQIIALA